MTIKELVMKDGGFDLYRKWRHRIVLACGGEAANDMRDYVRLWNKFCDRTGRDWDVINALDVMPNTPNVYHDMRIADYVLDNWDDLGEDVIYTMLCEFEHEYLLTYGESWKRDDVGTRVPLC